jgi:hypothetical protein
MPGKWQRQKTEFAEPDGLTRAIQRAIDELEAEGVIDPEVENADPEQDRYEGYCARSAQAYWRLAKEPAYRYLARDPDVEPYVLREVGEQAHYWVRVRTTGEVLDLRPQDAAAMIIEHEQMVTLAAAAPLSRSPQPLPNHHPTGPESPPRRAEGSQRSQNLPLCRHFLMEPTGIEPVTSCLQIAPF